MDKLSAIPIYFLQLIPISVESPLIHLQIFLFLWIKTSALLPRIPEKQQFLSLLHTLKVIVEW
jgi:hypothetical protein